MSNTLNVNGEPITYETEADAGINLTTGARWWGTRIKWRRGTSGKWNRVSVIDTHPFDTNAIELALGIYLSEKGVGT